MKILLTYFVLFLTLMLNADKETNVLLYSESVQVSSEINDYNNLVAGSPIHGTIMITHDSNNSIDAKSFSIGDKPLQVELVQSLPMSSYDNLVVTIYQFHLEGMNKGIHTLQPIKVNVGGKNYQAAPLVIQIP